MRRFAIVLAGLLASLFLIPASAQSQSYDTDYMRIMLIGCHLHDGECWVQFGPFFASSNPDGQACDSSDIRWNSITTPNGRTLLALLTSAWLSEELVSVRINGCYQAGDGGWRPTLGWVNLLKP